jgi:hypothetical protein
MKIDLISNKNLISLLRFLDDEIEEDQIDDELFDKTMEALSTKNEKLDDPTIYLSKNYSKAKPKPKGASARGKDMGNRLPAGGRSGNMKIDKFQGYRIPPMY